MTEVISGYEQATKKALEILPSKFCNLLCRVGTVRITYSVGLARLE